MLKIIFYTSKVFLILFIYVGKYLSSSLFLSLILSPRQSYRQLKVLELSHFSCQLSFKENIPLEDVNFVSNDEDLSAEDVELVSQNETFVLEMSTY